MQVHNSTYYLSSYTEVESAVLTLALLIIIFISICGGIIMLYVLYSNDKMWTSTNMLIGNLTFASTSVAVLVMPFSLLTAAKRKWIFGEGHVCKLTGFAASLLILVTILTHTVISIDKYFAVVKPMSRAMTVRKTGVFIFAIWALATAMSVLPLAGISRFEYNPTTLICGIGFPRRRLELLYLLILSSVGFLIPINIMTYAYIRVYLAVRQHTARLLAHAVLSTDVLVLQKKLILTVFFSLVCFLICWSTFFALTVTAVVIKDSSQLPRGLGIAAYWTGYLNSALNPVIICSMSVRFKEGFLNIYKRFLLFFKCKCCKRTHSLRKKISFGFLGNSTEMVDVTCPGIYERKISDFQEEANTEKKPSSISISTVPFRKHIICNGNN